ncbi:unnamed protein product [Ostreobium quekettii]|uniref:Uncharacterized protein n=1 Tax=Ostreobium quekettii TaxID=121088 RepID=A0A8S1IVD9_9CHLO|nr:unnamed protein product [Ostreobium quekettii]
MLELSCTDMYCVWVPGTHCLIAYIILVAMCTTALEGHTACRSYRFVAFRGSASAWCWIMQRTPHLDLHGLETHRLSISKIAIRVVISGSRIAAAGSSPIWCPAHSWP